MKNYWVIIVLIWSSCTFDKKNSPEELILGKWEIFQATRNGKDSKILENTYFLFGQQDTLSSNLFKNQDLKYKIEQTTIIQTGSTEMEYEIAKLTIDTLYLRMEIKRYKYLMKFVKRTK